MGELEHLVHAANELGEGALWHPDEQALYWLDILGRAVFRYDPATGNYQRFSVNTRVTVLGLRERGGFVVGSADGLGFWEPGCSEIDSIANPTAGQPGVRLNDGAVDPLGNFWVGSMNEVDETRSDGALYRLDPAGGLREMESGFTVSNGVDWSPDGRTMVFTDTRRRVILAYDFDLETGEISNRRTFAEIPDGQGFPDRLTVDTEGGVWSARWGGWRVVRHSPDGTVDRELRLPVANVTSCSFGGPDLDELYITSARVTLSDAELSGQAWAGDLFRVKVGVQGRPAFRYRG
ncbi:MAG: SMP-30/gluconolactonase/LRE family protein [Anaerolineales bacterium]|nr:SMP-30/gluconolactonase/LRE family protein [Anaerolineales bacterium]